MRGRVAAWECRDKKNVQILVDRKGRMQESTWIKVFLLSLWQRTHSADKFWSPRPHHMPYYSWHIVNNHHDTFTLNISTVEYKCDNGL